MRNETMVHLGHSGMLIKIAGETLIFDYATPERERTPNRGLTEGYIDAAELADESLTVFVSHHHPDHFTKDIFAWRDVCNRIQFVVSDDVTGLPDSVQALGPGRMETIGALSIRTYPSTDIGLAFSVFVDGRHVYFCGDNAYWNWDNEVPEAEYIRDVLSQLDRSQPIDIGMQVCDPRLDKWGAGGILLFAETIQPRLLVPVHSFGNYRYNLKIEERLKNTTFSGQFWPIRRRGERWLLDRNEIDRAET